MLSIGKVISAKLCFYFSSIKLSLAVGGYFDRVQVSSQRINFYRQCILQKLLLTPEKGGLIIRMIGLPQAMQPYLSRFQCLLCLFRLRKNYDQFLLGEINILTSFLTSKPSVYKLFSSLLPRDR